MKKKKYWYDYLYVASALYLFLGFFNIMCAWLGLICFFVPLAIAVIGGSKLYCGRYCGRGQLFELLGRKWKLSRGKETPAWMYSRAFRLGFLIFFLTMFGNMLYTTYLVFSGARGLRQVVTLFWVFKVPWSWAYSGADVWQAQFAFGFYSLMLTSTLLGLITMVLFRPRSWCVYCPMGTMTQCICRLKAGKEEGIRIENGTDASFLEKTDKGAAG